MADEEYRREEHTVIQETQNDEELESTQERPRVISRREYFQKRQRRCAFCADPSARIDYKDTDTLWHYLTEYGKIRPRRQTALCAKHQRELAKAVKRARHLALLPFVMDVRRLH